MTKVSYHPEPGSPDETTQFGYDFADGKPTTVTDGAALAKFRANQFFKVHTEKAEKPKSENAGLKAVHIAGGRFVIKDGDTVVKEGLNKADADAFNAMSDEDKAEYVK